MPRLPIDYSKTIIYKLVCTDITVKDVYVGATTKFLGRKAQHKSRCNNPNDKAHSLPVYVTIRQNGGWNNWDMVEVIKQSCSSSTESHKLERSYVELLGATLNRCVPSRTHKEYYQDYKEDIINNVKKYREGHKEEIKLTKSKYNQDHKAEAKITRSKYYQDHKEDINNNGKKYRESHIAETKITRSKYYQDHKAEAKLKAAKYYQDHKEDIKMASSKYYYSHKISI